MTDWSFDAWPAITPEPWRMISAYDKLQFHVDLGCGTIKKGRIGVDRYPAPGVNVVMDLDSGLVYDLAGVAGADARGNCPGPSWGGRMSGIRPIWFGFPFPRSSIQSIITSHCFEHIGDGFIPLMDDIYRVLVPDGILRAITPRFPTPSAVSDPDHKRYFTENTWLSFCGHLGDDNNPTGCWYDSFSVPYTAARFEMVEQHALDEELRVTLRAVK